MARKYDGKLRSIPEYAPIEVPHWRGGNDTAQGYCENGYEYVRNPHVKYGGYCRKERKRQTMTYARSRSGEMVEVRDKDWNEHTHYVHSGMEKNDRDLCYAKGGIFVDSYFKSTGEYVKGHCKDKRRKR